MFSHWDHQEPGHVLLDNIYFWAQFAVELWTFGCADLRGWLIVDQAMDVICASFNACILPIPVLQQYLTTVKVY